MTYEFFGILFMKSVDSELKLNENGVENTSIFKFGVIIFCVQVLKGRYLHKMTAK